MAFLKKVWLFVYSYLEMIWKREKGKGVTYCKEEEKETELQELESEEILEFSEPIATYQQFEGWEEVDSNILLFIFQKLDILELFGVSQVCRSWRLASSDHFVWNTLDLRFLKSNFIHTIVPPYIYVSRKCERLLRKLLKISVALSRGNITYMIFHVDLYMNDSQLSLLAERCPNLKRLVLPNWDCITESGICQAVERWPNLESMTMPSILYSFRVMEEIGRSCKNFTQLKIMGSFSEDFATSIANHIPKLTVLSLRCSRVTKGALMVLLDFIENLEVLNISHCLIVDHYSSLSLELAYSKMDRTIMKKASHLRKFLYCSTSSCLTCQRMISDGGYMKWWKYEEEAWSQEEVKSLCSGEYRNSFDYNCLFM